MTKDEIIDMARQAGIFKGLGDGQGLWLANDKDIEAFAKLVAEREREQCALICDAEWGTSDEQTAGVMFSKEIRARGEA